MNDQVFWDHLVRLVNKILHPAPPFAVGDIVRFEPSKRTLGWTQDLGGLYPGYVGKVTRVERGYLGEWGVYVDDKPEGFLSSDFRLVKRRDE